jgi:phenylacetate-CoA ligase
MLKSVMDCVEYWAKRDIVHMARLAPSIPPVVLDFRSRVAFRDVARWVAKNSPYYQQKFTERNIDPSRLRRVEDLRDFFTWPEDVQQAPESFLCRPPQLVFETSGTTGSPKRTYFSYPEIDRISRYEACALYYCGVRSSDRVLSTFDQGFWVTGPVTEATLRHLNVFGSVVGKLDLHDAFRRIRNDRYTVLMADPTWLSGLTDVARQASSVPKLKLILCGGDRLPECNRKYAQNIWNCPVLQGYGTTETGGVIASECLQRDGLHLDTFNLLVEIVDPDPEGFGEIVVTTLSRRVMPLIRYRTRDVARFTGGDCVCGAKVPRISALRTRRDEIVVMGAGNIYPLLLERLVERVPNWPRLWRASVRQQDGRDLLEFQVEKNGSTSPRYLEEKIKDQIRDQQPGMWANLQCSMYRVRVVETAPDGFPQGRKMRRLVDER